MLAQFNALSERVDELERKTEQHNAAIFGSPQSVGIMSDLRSVRESMERMIDGMAELTKAVKQIQRYVFTGIGILITIKFVIDIIPKFK